MLPDNQKKGSCRPCRDRLAQCDRKKPRCTECVNKNKQCGGYDMGHIFINVNSTGPPPLWNRTQNAQKYLVLDLVSQPQFPTISQSPSASVPTQTQWPNFPNPDPKNVHAMVDVFLDLYYRRFGPEKTSTDLLTPGNESGGWRYLLPYWLGQSPILDTAIGALAASFIGSQYQDERLIDHARNMYLHALQMVQKALPEPNSTQRKDLLATTLVMSSTELFMFNEGGTGQVAHIEGATKLLNASLKTLQFEELHVYILNQGLFESLASRRHYLFSSDEYRDAARQIYSCSRTSRNELYFQWCEIILPLPNILRASDSMAIPGASSRSSSSTSSSTTALALLNELTRMEQALSSWYDRVKANMPGPWTVPATVVGADSVPYPLQFASVEVCTVYCLYWTSQVLILDTRNSLYSQVPRSELSELPASDLSSQMAEYASLICRSVQFCTQNTSFATTENILVPLFVVTSFYSRQGDEERTQWCMNAFARISQSHKLSFATAKLDLAEQKIHTGPVRLSGVWDQA
ncbi:hypothetical protein BS50DRAFT_264546 [Corynespora cassiicola Philippines]|uniref:Zn(2)-C6 fungal-type domain-containing protein n=1 Tax=Corynespora cassiicola Philippines TaxID=1448308 RepID=A0A2T2NYV1_CORCC|nr:hypothetical protein BS50DRAFT_264546 [Corynespora cassiicola Philippines]